MGRSLNRRNVLLLIAAIGILPLGGYWIWFGSAALRGRWTARHDLADGHYRILAYGLPRAGVAEYRDLMARWYGVEYRQIALCTVSEGLVSYADAYDGVSAPAIERRFGSDVFEKTWDEATRLWKEKNKAALQQAGPVSEEAFGPSVSCLQPPIKRSQKGAHHASCKTGDETPREAKKDT
jgi:hypothetical protein